MSDSLRDTANEIITFLSEIPTVRKCRIYGSLATDTYDELSDIDIEIDVSGYDNGQFMLELVELLKGKFSIYYSDYAPSLIPDRCPIARTRCSGSVPEERNPRRLTPSKDTLH